MNGFIKKYVFIVALLVLGLSTRFLFISHPSDVVWDEQHFGTFTKGYFEKKYFFDIHPPLGKFLLFGALKIAGADPGDFDFKIGTPYPANYPYVAARFFSAFLGGILPFIIYLFARALTLSKRSSFLVSAFVLLDNALFAESHFALIDIFVPVFGFAGLIFFLKHRDTPSYSRRWWLFLALAAVGGTSAASVKWTGIGALVVMGIATLIECVEQKAWKTLFARFGILVSISVIFYASLYWAHFKMLPNSGPGDAFMSERFKASLRGTAESQRGDVAPLDFFEKLTELNKKMFVVNAGQTLTHPDSSRFYEWPVGRKRIYFWTEKDGGARRIYLIANPVVWLFGLGSLAGIIGLFIFRHRRIRELLMAQPEWRTRIYSLEFLLLVFFVNWLPFAAVTRAMFLYHYFTSLIASLILGAFLFFELIPALGAVKTATTSGRRENQYLYWILLALATGAFVLFSPLSYGYRPFVL